jgi:hypothetical protein
VRVAIGAPLATGRICPFGFSPVTKMSILLISKLFPEKCPSFQKPSLTAYKFAMQRANPSLCAAVVFWYYALTWKAPCNS